MPDNLLYLFSSNIRPLYLQDILDVLGAPRGARYQFRYDIQKKYVAPDVLAASLAGTSALVHFSIQQEAHYHPPAFIPVRRAVVVDAAVRSDIFVIDFEVGDYVALKRSEDEELAECVHRYTASLDRHDIGHPYGPSASIGVDLREKEPELFDTDADEAGCFRSTAVLLQRTEWFKQAHFVRATAIREGTRRGQPVPLTEGTYELTSGSTYELELTHYEPADVTKRDSFTITADDDVVQIIGRAGFDIASTYDYIRMYMHVSLPARDEPKETIVSIGPDSGVQGPTIRLPVRAVPPRGRQAALALGTVATLFLLGLPAAWTSLSQPLKFGLVVVGALIASLLQTYGLPVSVPSGFGFTNQPSTGSSASNGVGLLMATLRPHQGPPRNL